MKQFLGLILVLIASVFTSAVHASPTVDQKQKQELVTSADVVVADLATVESFVVTPINSVVFAPTDVGWHNTLNPISYSFTNEFAIVKETERICLRDLRKLSSERIYVNLNYTFTSVLLLNRSVAGSYRNPRDSI